MKNILTFIVISVLTIGGNANAAVHAGVATAFNNLKSDFLEIMSLVWPVAITIMLSFAILALVKKAWGKIVDDDTDDDTSGGTITNGDYCDECGNYTVDVQGDCHYCQDIDGY